MRPPQMSRMKLAIITSQRIVSKPKRSRNLGLFIWVAFTWPSVRPLFLYSRFRSNTSSRMHISDRARIRVKGIMACSQRRENTVLSSQR